MVWSGVVVCVGVCALTTVAHGHMCDADTNPLATRGVATTCAMHAGELVTLEYSIEAAEADGDDDDL